MKKLFCLLLASVLIGTTFAMEDDLLQVLFSEQEIPKMPNDVRFIFVFLSLITNEKEKIEGALYDLVQPSLIEALQKAVDRGVSVAIYMDEGNYDKRGLNKYDFIHPIKSPSDPLARSKALMHEKFLIFYKQKAEIPGATQKLVCYGSWNPTDHGLFPTCDEMIIDNTPAIIEKFKQEILNLQVHVRVAAAEIACAGSELAAASLRDGPSSLAGESVAIAATDVADPVIEAKTYPRVLFSPSERAQMPIILCTLLNDADMRSCKCAMTWFSNVSVTDALYGAAVRNHKEICLIVDQDSFAKSNLAWRVPHSLVYAGPECMMHHKFFIFAFEGKPMLLWSGSWNCSHDATNYDCVVMRNDSVVPDEFNRRFTILFEKSLRSVTKAAFAHHVTLAKLFTKNQRYFSSKKKEFAEACSDVPACAQAPCIQEFLKS